MYAIFDNLIAIMVAGIALLALTTIQIRDRTASVRMAVHGAAASQAASAVDILAQDMDNAMSRNLATSEMGTYRCSLTRSADDERTVRLEIPAYVRPAAAAAPRAVHLRYTLVAEGDSVLVSGRMVPRYELRRAIDDGSGYGADQTVARNLTDLDVTFRGRASERTTGPPPLRFTSIAVDLSLAVPSTVSSAGDQTNVGTENQATAGVSVRPPNLTTDT